MGPAGPAGPGAPAGPAGPGCTVGAGAGGLADVTVAMAKTELAAARPPAVMKAARGVRNIFAAMSVGVTGPVYPMFGQ